MISRGYSIPIVNSGHRLTRQRTAEIVLYQIWDCRRESQISSSIYDRATERARSVDSKESLPSILWIGENWRVKECDPDTGILEHSTYFELKTTLLCFNVKPLGLPWRGWKRVVISHAILHEVTMRWIGVSPRLWIPSKASLAHNLSSLIYVASQQACIYAFNCNGGDSYVGIVIGTFLSLSFLLARFVLWMFGTAIL